MEFKQTQVETPDGEVLTIEHPADATEEQILSFAKSQWKEPEVGLKGVAEAAATVGSAIVAEPVAGIGGIVQSINPFTDQTGGDAVEAIRNAMTYMPDSKEGKQALGNLAEFVEPLAEGMEGWEKSWGESVLEATDSPALAAAAHTAPTAFLEAIGLGAIKKGSTAAKSAGKVDRTDPETVKRNDPVPTTEELFEASKGIYTELDELGATVTPEAYGRLAREVKKTGDDLGADPDVTPKGMKAIVKVLERIGDEDPAPITLTEIQNMRKVAQNAAKVADGGDKAIGAGVVNAIDDFLATAGDDSFLSPPGVNIGQRQRVAGKLYGAAKKSELINNAIEDAKKVKSGFENGIRNELAKLTQRKAKTRRFFSEEEIKEIDKVVQGSKSANLFRALGRLSFMEGGAHNMTQPLVAMGVVSLYDPAVAIAVPIIGFVSRQLAVKLTEGNARFADSVVRAGNDGRKITLAYTRAHPNVADRDPKELAQLLIDKDLSTIKTKFGKEAAEIAKKAKVPGESGVPSIQRGEL